MGVLEKLEWLFRPPEIRVGAYRCLECGTTMTTEADACPDCAGEVEETSRAIEYTYWGLYE